VTPAARRILVLAALALPLGACAYYNSMYNAVHLARDADKAEAQGRTFDAQSLWGQVAVKAETTIARHPKSKWAEPARFLAGKAYERLGNCGRAVSYLELIRSSGRDTSLALPTRELLGDCYETLGDPAAAAAAFRPLTASPDSAIRSRALYVVGKAELVAGRPDSAIAPLAASRDPRAPARLVVALARAGRVPAAVALADTLLARKDTALVLDTLFDAVGTADPAAGSALVDRFAADTTPAVRAGWLVSDGDRWLARDTGRAVARWRAALAAVPPGDEAARAAATRIAGHWIAGATGPAALDSAIAILTPVVSGPGSYDVERRLQLIQRLRAEYDSLDPTAPAGDLRTFLGAEAMRDSLGATRIATELFRRLAERAPASPYAPKALLALAQLDPAAADSVSALLDARYPASPYVLAVHGLAAPGFRVLEDSLRKFADARTAAPPARPVRRGRVLRDTLDLK
jgi:hypothetical protein